VQIKPKGVRATHPEYDEYAPIWQTVEDVEEGQRAIHAKREQYLPRLKGEDDTDYKSRLYRSDFFNAFWRTVSGLTGMAFRVPPVVTVPNAILPALDDIDLAGTSLDAMAKDITEDVIEYGRVGLLVDHPPMPENVTAISQRTAEALGLRPVMQVYGPLSIINWRFARVGNAWRLVLVVLKEMAAIPISEYEYAEEAQYRVLDLDERGFYRQRLYRIDKHDKDEQIGDDIYPIMNGQPMTEIPFTFIGANGMNADCDLPPLIDLIDANLAHYGLQSDYRHGLHFTGLPTLFLAGVTQAPGAPPVYVGGSAAIVSDHPDAKGMFIEFTGQGLGALEKAIASMEQRMAMLGARMVADETKQAETLGATQIKRAGENSVMAAIVGGVSGAIEWALELFCQWSGVTGEVAYKINNRMTPTPMGPQELTALVGAWQAGAISEVELFGNLQEGEIIDGGKTIDEHQEEVASGTIGLGGASLGGAIA